MERHVKERLVGAAVLMAAAIILIPEMLSGPDCTEREPVAQRQSEEAAVKTYTIDLNRPPGAVPEQAAVDGEEAPPPENEQPVAAELSSRRAPLPANADEANPEPVVDTPPAHTSATVSKPPASQTSSAVDTPKPASQPVPSRPAQEATPRVLASESTVPTTRGWAVQLGSFSSRASADRLAAELRAEQYEAFVMPVKSGASTLYRVRVGPMRDRATADETLRRVKAKVAGAAVVAHP